MPRLTGVFDYLKDSYKIPIGEISKWLKTREQEQYLENFIGNSILYPQTVPITAWDLEVDMAILREFIKYHQELFFNPTAKKIFIPEEFIPRFPPLQELVKLFIESLPLESGNTIYIKRVAGTTPLGSVIVGLGEDTTSINIDDEEYPLKKDQLNSIVKTTGKVLVRLGVQNNLWLVGGALGILVDLRKKAPK